MLATARRCAETASTRGDGTHGGRGSAGVVFVLLLAVALLLGNPPAVRAETPIGLSGQIASWGDNWSGQLGDGSGNSSPVPVRVDTSGALAGKSVTQVSAGSQHVCAVTSLGEAVCWGQNGLGELGVPIGEQVFYREPVKVDASGVLAGTAVRRISAGATHTCAVTTQGQAACWGLNGGALGNGSAANSAAPVAVDTSGVLAGKTLVEVSSGEGHTCALSSQDQVFCWGYNGPGGVLGDGTTTNTLVPVAVDTSGALAGQVVKQVAAGPFFSCAATSRGQAVCWGTNYYGRLGLGTDNDSRVPAAVDASGVLAGKTVTQVDTGYYHACAVTSDGQVACWGSNSSGQLGDGNVLGVMWTPVVVATG